MTAKEYLKQIRLLDSRIRMKKEQLDELQASIVFLRGIAYDADRVQSSPEDNMSASIARLVELENEIIRDTTELSVKKNKIIGEIQQLDDAQLEKLLHMRYIQFLTFENIADEMNIDIRWVYYMHKKSLKTFQKKFEIA